MDSAAGNARQGRDRKTQGVLAIRGKILNVEKATEDRVRANKEIELIKYALGCGELDDYDEERLRYGKVILLTDADVDGSHIQVLLLTYLYKRMPQLIESGRVYIARPPLYSVEGEDGKDKYYWDKQKAREDYPNGELSRFKGLGEQPMESLVETAMDPKTRIIEKVTLEDTLETTILIDKLMGTDTAGRKEWISGINFDD